MLLKKLTNTEDSRAEKLLEGNMVFSYNSGSKSSRLENTEKLNYATSLRKTLCSWFLGAIMLNLLHALKVNMMEP